VQPPLGSAPKAQAVEVGSDFPAYVRVDGAINFILCLRPAVHAQIDAKVRQYFSPYSRRLVNPMHSSLPRGGLALSPDFLFALI